MLNFMNIGAREATLNCHEVLAPKSLGLNLFFRQDNFAPLMFQLST